MTSQTNVNHWTGWPGIHGAAGACHRLNAAAASCASARLMIFGGYNFSNFR
jgi:hypothetical protein